MQNGLGSQLVSIHNKKLYGRKAEKCKLVAESDDKNYEVGHF